MTKQKTRKELEEERKTNFRWFVFYWVVGLLFAISLMVSLIHSMKLQNQFSECQDKIPEVINGNLYIGYEDGVRIGYHQDYLDKRIWYRCARDCEVIE